MATYYIYRKDFPGTLSPLILEHKARAFRTLYCGMGAKNDPKLKIVIRGVWPSYDKDGLFLTGQGAEIISIGRKYVTVKLLEYKDEKLLKIELTPANDPGFSEIMFITMDWAA